jgi:hypothetical protein
MVIDGGFFLLVKWFGVIKTRAIIQTACCEGQERCINKIKERRERGRERGWEEKGAGHPG